jgi:hypothetical protein
MPLKNQATDTVTFNETNIASELIVSEHNK